MSIPDILPKFEAILLEKGWRDNFSDSEWEELNTITSTSDFDIENQKKFWKKLLMKWITRNNDPRRKIYDEIFIILKQYVVLLEDNSDWLKDQLPLLYFHLSQSEIEQQNQQLLFLQFECQQRQERIRSLELESEQTRAEFYALIELNLFISEHLVEDEIVKHALDGLLGILDANYTAILVFQEHSYQGPILYIYQYGDLQKIEDFKLDNYDFWKLLMVSDKYSRYFDDIEFQIPEYKDYLRGIFPDTRSFLTNQLRIADKLLGLVIASSTIPTGLGGFTHFVNIISTNLASSIQNARLHARINELAISDGTTGLYNRRYFEERLEQNLARCKRYNRELSVLMMDIDKFKGINDTYGHQAGDAVLRQVAQILQERLRTTDMVGRYGGEEFIILLDETNSKGALKVAQDLVKEISLQMIDIDRDAPIQITISAGYSSYPSDGSEISELVKVADQGLYYAKENGRNRVGFMGGSSSVIQ